MVKVLLLLGGVAILLVISRQVLLMFRDGSFRARGNRLIVRNVHCIIFWMNFIGLVLFGVVGIALICWQLLYLSDFTNLVITPNSIVNRETGFAGVTMPTCNTRAGLSGTTA
jgi:hypothetical protein